MDRIVSAAHLCRCAACADLKTFKASQLYSARGTEWGQAERHRLSRFLRICENCPNVVRSVTMAGIVGAAHLQPTCSLGALPAERRERPERRGGERGTQACASFATTVEPGSAHGKPPRAEGIGERVWTNLWITCYFKPYLRVQFFKLGLNLLSKVRGGFYQAIKMKPSNEKLIKASVFTIFLHILSYQTSFCYSVTNSGCGAEP